MSGAVHDAVGRTSGCTLSCRIVMTRQLYVLSYVESLECFRGTDPQLDNNNERWFHSRFGRTANIHAR